jgi:beta-ureidopropionase / N-carbamoyl-L-amino-acid hydrolase
MTAGATLSPQVCAADAALATELFDALRAQTSDGVGISRDSYGPRETVGLDIIDSKARQLGLQTERDAGANLVVTLPGREPELPFIACGSHLDSVPQGGNFDGAAGVVAGLAVLARLKKTNVPPRRSLKLFGLRGEESARFGKAYMGSSALFGRLKPDDLANKDPATGRTLAECMADVGVDVARVTRGEALIDPKTVGAWIELHIEQGPVLIARKLPVGIVTGIRGNVRHRAVTCIGEAGHSGAVPRWLRHDAVFAAADLITHIDRHWRTLLERGRDVVVTTGIFGTDPGEHAIARIPGSVQFSIDIRSQSKETLEAFYDLFLSECTMIGEERGVKFGFDRRIDSAPATMDAEWIGRLNRAAQRLEIPAEEMPSGAGHDAAVFANAGIPSAMVFVRNENGSHNPREAMTIEDFLSGVSVMRTAIEEALQ